MGLKTYIAGQFRKPTGIIGKMIGKLMNKSNARMNETTIRLLTIEEQDHVLEIGFGNGKYIAEIAEKIKGSRVSGLDFSETMVQLAAERNRAFIEEGRVRLKQGKIEEIPFEDSLFDKIFTVNTIYFWSDPHHALQEVKRVLKPGGRLAIGFRSKAKMSQLDAEKQGFYLYTPEEVKNLLKDNGFVEIVMEYSTDKPMDFYCAVAKK